MTRTAIRFLLIFGLLAQSWPGTAAHLPAGKDTVTAHFLIQAVSQPSEFSGSRPGTHLNSIAPGLLDHARPSRRTVIKLGGIAGVLTLVKLAFTPRWLRAQTVDTSIEGVRAALQNLREHPTDAEAIRTLATMTIADERIEGDLLILILRELKGAVPGNNPAWSAALEQVLLARLSRPNATDVLLAAMAEAPRREIRQRLKELLAVRAVIVSGDAAMMERFYAHLRAARRGAIVREDHESAMVIDTVLHQDLSHMNIVGAERQSPPPANRLTETYRKFFEHQLPAPPVRIYLTPQGPRPPTPEEEKEQAREQKVENSKLVLSKQVESLNTMVEDREGTVAKTLLEDPSAIQSLFRLSLQGFDPDPDLPPEIHVQVAEVRRLASITLARLWSLEPTLRGDTLAYGVKMGIIPADQVASDSSLTPSARRVAARAIVTERAFVDPTSGTDDLSDPREDARLTIVQTRVPRGPVPKTVKVRIQLTPGSMPISGNEATITANPGTSIIAIKPGAAITASGKQLATAPEALSVGDGMDPGVDSARIAVLGPNAGAMPSGMQMEVTLKIEDASVRMATLNVLEQVGTTPTGNPLEITVDTARANFRRMTLVGYAHMLTRGTPPEKEAGAHGLVDALTQEIASAGSLRPEFGAFIRSLGTPTLEAAGQWAKEHALDLRVVSEFERLAKEASSAMSLWDKTRAAAAAVACDLNLDGFVNYFDVDEIVKMILRQKTCTANIIAPGQCTIAVAQRVVNASLPGGTCNTGNLHSVTLTWNASISANVIGYNMYRATGDPNGTYVRLNGNTPIVGLSFFDGVVNGGQTYYYYATAVDAFGRESLPSNPPANFPGRDVTKPFPVPATIPIAGLQNPAPKNVENASGGPPRRRFWRLAGLYSAV